MKSSPAKLDLFEILFLYQKKYRKTHANPNTIKYRAHIAECKPKWKSALSDVVINPIHLIFS